MLEMEKIVHSFDHTLPEVVEARTDIAVKNGGAQCQFACGEDSPGLVHYDTASGGLIAKDSDDPTVVAPRKNLTSGSDYGPLHASWTAMPPSKKKLTLPTGRLVEAKTSPSGLTMILLSEKQVMIHPIENSLGMNYKYTKHRYPVTRDLLGFPLLNASGKLRSASVSDEFVLLRGAGQVRLADSCVIGSRFAYLLSTGTLVSALLRRYQDSAVWLRVAVARYFRLPCRHEIMPC